MENSEHQCPNRSINSTNSGSEAQGITYDKQVVDRIESPRFGSRRGSSDLAPGIGDADLSHDVLLDDSLPMKHGQDSGGESLDDSPLFAADGEYTEEEKALLQPLPTASDRQLVGNAAMVATSTLAAAHQRSSHHANASLEESMDVNDYMMMTETLREVSNPLLQTKHDPSLSTTDAGLGGMPDLEQRVNLLVRDAGTSAAVVAGDAQVTTRERQEEEEMADKEERRTHRRRLPSPPADQLPRATPTAAHAGRHGTKGTTRADASVAGCRGRGHLTVTAAELASKAGNGDTKSSSFDGNTVFRQPVVVAPTTNPAQGAEEEEEAVGVSAGVRHGATDAYIVLQEPSPCELAANATAAASPFSSPSFTSPPRPPPRDEVEISSSPSQPSSALKENEEQSKGPPSLPVGGAVSQVAVPRRLKLTVGGASSGGHIAKKKDDADGGVNEEEEEASTLKTDNAPPRRSTASVSSGTRLKLKGAPPVATVDTLPAPSAEEPPPRKLLRLGVTDDEKRSGSGRDLSGKEGTLFKDSAFPIGGEKAREYEDSVSTRQAGSPNGPNSPSLSVLSPRFQRPSNARDDGNAVAPVFAGPSSSACSPTVVSRRGEASATMPAVVAAAATRSGSGGGSASRVRPASPLSPRRATGDAPSAFAAFVASPAVGGGAGGAVAGLRAQRSKPTTPTPTPTALYNLSDATPHRTHAAAKVPLPLAPIKVDFGTVGQWVEDTYEVTEKISEGTYGEVYKGRVKATGEPVALKRLKTLRGLDGFPITSLREVIALQHINRQRRRLFALEQEKQTRENEEAGRNRGATTVRQESRSDPLEEIVPLRDVLLSKEATHDIYLVFSYANSSMAGLMTRRFPFTLSDIAYIFRKIVMGVKKLHDMGIIHRDIKTDNVLISHDGAVQLADFGLCVFDGSGARALTPSMINLSYRPPEMLLGSTQYDKKVDIWSVGCFLAQVFLHQPPFYRRKNPEEQARVARHNRSAETELEQLAAIAEVLGPISGAPADAFPPSTCAHLEHLKRLQEAVLGASSGGGQSYFSSPTARAAPASTPAAVGLAKMEALFKPSFSFQQFRGFRRWFASQMDIKRTQYILSGSSSSGSPRPSSLQPLLLPSPACIDVLEAIFQYDPRKRPTAAQLLCMPFFQLFDREGGVPGLSPHSGSAYFSNAGRQLQQQQHQAGEDEALRGRVQVARGRLSERLRGMRDSHLQPPPKPQ